MKREWFLAIVLIVSLFFSSWRLSEYFIKGISRLTLSDFHTYYYIPKIVLGAEKTIPYGNFTPMYPYFFPPQSILLLSPLSLAPFAYSKIIWTFFNLILVLATALIISQIFSKHINPATSFAITLLLMAMTYPLNFTISDGQFNLVILFVITASFYLSTKKGDYPEFLSAFLISLGSVTKVSPFILILYFLQKRRFKIIAATLTFIAVFTILSEIFVAKGINTYYIRHVVKTISRQAGGVGYKDQSINALLKRSTTLKALVLTSSQSLSVDEENIYSALNYFIVGLFIIWFFVLKKVKSDFSDLLEFSYLSVVGVIGTGLTWVHQYVILILPVIVAVYLSAFSKKYLYLILALLSYFLIGFESPKFFGAFVPSFPWFMRVPTMTYGAFLLLFVISRLLLVNNFSPVVLKFYLKFKVVMIILAASFVSYLFFAGTWNEHLEGRDKARVEGLTFMDKRFKTLSKNDNIPFVPGVYESYNGSILLKHGWVPIKKEYQQVAAQRLSTLYVDPINSKDYKYVFSSDGKRYKLSARLESDKFVSLYEEYFTLGSDSGAKP